jgi:cytochrome c556
MAGLARWLAGLPLTRAMRRIAWRFPLLQTVFRFHRPGLTDRISDCRPTARSLSRMTSMRTMIVSLWLVLALVMATALPPATGQSQTTGLTGVDKPGDVVQARQTVMDGIDTEMHDIDQAGAGERIPLDALKAHADRISTLLTAFPHLFPPQTQPSPDAPVPTTAAPAVWKEFEDFYGRAMAAAKTALDASQAATLELFRPLGMDLRAACDSCHAKYMQVDQPKP